MAEVFPQNILLRVGGRTLARHGVLAVAGSRRGLVELPYTFARADASTCATYIDRDGIIRLAAANVPRVEWWDLDGDGIKEPYYLHEGTARTNSWLRSEEFGDAAWNSKINMTVTSNSALAPDGATTGDTFVESTDGAPATHSIGQTLPALTDNTNQCASIHVRPGSRTWLLVEFKAKNAAFYDASFNLSGSGSVGTVTSGARGIIVAKFSLSDGTIYYRCSMVMPSNSGGTTPFFNFYPATADGVSAATYQGNGGNSLYLWGAQFEKDVSFPSSYIKTVASAVTRAADSLTVACNFGQMSMSTFLRFGERGTATSSSTAGPASFGSGSLPFSRFDSFGTSYRYSNQQVAGAVASIAAAAPAIGQETKLLGVIFPDGSVRIFQSIAGGADSGGSQSGAQALSAGGLWSTQLLTPGGGGWHGLLGDLVVLRDAHTMAEATAVS